MSSEFGNHRLRESRNLDGAIVQIPPKYAKPFAVEAVRDDYVILRLTIRSRRDWRTVKPADRYEILLQVAEVLDEYAAQIREEAEEIEGLPV